MPSESPTIALRNRIIRTPKAVTTLTDRQLSTLLRGPPDSARVEIAAESLFRRWLYGERCPEAIRCGIEALFSDEPSDSIDGRNRFKAWIEASLLTRHNRQVALPNQDALAPDEKNVSDLFARRVEDFRSSDGLIALVPETGAEIGDGVVVAFKLEPGVGIVAGDDTPLQSWDDDLKLLRESHNWDMRVRVCAVFPLGFEASGRSLGLALVLARERLRGSLPWFDPLDLLATGKVENSAVTRVDGTAIKHELATRIGCRHFVGPGVTATSHTIALPLDTAVSSALAAVRAGLQNYPVLPSSAWEILRRCEREVAQSDAADFELSTRRLHEIHRMASTAVSKLAYPLGNSREVSQALSLIDNVGSRIWGDKFGNIIEEQERLVIGPYRARPIYGREVVFSNLNTFLEKSPGGLCLIKGKAGFGKTATLAHWLAKELSGACRFVHFFRSEHDRLRAADDFFARLAAFLQTVIPADFLRGAQRGEKQPEEAVRRLLRTYSRIPPDERSNLLIVVDALDEALPRYFENFFPFTAQSWPAGLFVVISARTPDEAELNALSTWVPVVTTEVPVDGLSDRAILNWLRAYPDPRLRPLANEPSFVTKLLERSQGEGCALYIEHVLGELAGVKDIEHEWERRIADLPPGYIKLVEFQYHRAFDQEGMRSSAKDMELFRKFLEVLAVSRGPLDETDLRALLKTSLIPDTRELPRWITTGQGVHDRGARFWYSNPLIREALGQMGLPLAEARRDLMVYCTNWATNHSPYAVQHLIAHLEKDGSVTDVYRTAGSDEFLEAQAAMAGGDVRAPLRTLQAALRAAIQHNDVEQMILFARKHAKHVSKLARQCPRQAFREGLVEKALSLVDVYEASEDQILWYLVLSADAVRRGDVVSGVNLLDEKFPKHLFGTQLGPEHSKCAVAVCALLFSKISPRTARRITRMLSPAAQIELCVLLASRKHYEKCDATLRTMRPGQQRDEASRAIIREKAKNGDPRHLDSQVLQIDNYHLRDWAWVDIAKVLIDMGDLRGAERIYSKIRGDHLLQRTDVLCSAAEKLMALGNVTDAKSALRIALENIADRTRPGTPAPTPALDLLYARAASRVAITELKFNLPKTARQTLLTAIERVKGAQTFNIAKARCLFDVLQTIEESARGIAGIEALVFDTLEFAKACVQRNSDDTTSLEYKSQIFGDAAAAELARHYIYFRDYPSAWKSITSIKDDERRMLARAAFVEACYRDNVVLPKHVTRTISRRDTLGAFSGVVLLLAVDHEGAAVDMVTENLRLRAPHAGAEDWGEARLLEALGVAYSQHGAAEHARFVLAAAEEQVRQRPLPARPYAWALLNLAQANAKAGRHDTAKELLVEIRRIVELAEKETLECRARLLCEVGQTQARCSFSEDAVETFELARSVIERFPVSQISESVVALGELIEAQCKASMQGAAIETLRFAKDALSSMDSKRDSAWTAAAALALSVAKSIRFLPEFSSEADGLVQLARAALQAGPRKQLLSARTDPHDAIDRVSAFLHALEGEVEAALEDAAEIRDPGLRSKALRDIAIACIDAGQPKELLTILSLMTTGRSQLLPDVAEELVRVKNFEKFGELFFLASSYLDATFRMSALLVDLHNPAPAIVANIESPLIGGSQS